MVFLLVALCAAFAATPAAQQVSSTQAPAILPQQFAGWQRQGSVETSADPSSADPTNAAVLREYRFTDFALHLPPRRRPHLEDSRRALRRCLRRFRRLYVLSATGNDQGEIGDQGASLDNAFCSTVGTCWSTRYSARNRPCQERSCASRLALCRAPPVAPGTCPALSSSCRDADTSPTPRNTPWDRRRWLCWLPSLRGSGGFRRQFRSVVRPLQHAERRSDVDADFLSHPKTRRRSSTPYKLGTPGRSCRPANPKSRARGTSSTSAPAQSSPSSGTAVRQRCEVPSRNGELGS